MIPIFHKPQNPCKICLQTVTVNNGLQCEGACKKWAHFTCLRLSSKEVEDIQQGVTKVSCPCPDCNRNFLPQKCPGSNCGFLGCPALRGYCENINCPTQSNCPASKFCNLPAQQNDLDINELMKCPVHTAAALEENDANGNAIFIECPSMPKRNEELDGDECPSVKSKGPTCPGQCNLEGAKKRLRQIKEQKEQIKAKEEEKIKTEEEKAKELQVQKEKDKKLESQSNSKDAQVNLPPGKTKSQDAQFNLPPAKVPDCPVQCPIPTGTQDGQLIQCPGLNALQDAEANQHPSQIQTRSQDAQDGQFSPDPVNQEQFSPGPLNQGQFSPSQFSQGPLNQGQYSPGPLNQGQYSPGPLSQGQLSPGPLNQSQSRQGPFSPGQFNQDQFSPYPLNQGQSSPGQLGQGQTCPGALCQGPLKKGQLSPGQSSPQYVDSDKRSDKSKKKKKDSSQRSSQIPNKDNKSTQRPNQNQLKGVVSERSLGKSTSSPNLIPKKTLCQKGTCSQADNCNSGKGKCSASDQPCPDESACEGLFGKSRPTDTPKLFNRTNQRTSDNQGPQYYKPSVNNSPSNYQRIEDYQRPVPFQCSPKCINYPLPQDQERSQGKLKDSQRSKKNKSSQDSQRSKKNKSPQDSQRSLNIKPSQDSQRSKKIKSSQDSERSKKNKSQDSQRSPNIEPSQDSQRSKKIKSPQESQRSQNVKPPQDLQRSQNIQPPQNSQRSQNYQPPQDYQRPQNYQPPQGPQDYNNPQNYENLQNVNRPQNLQPPQNYQYPPNYPRFQEYPPPQDYQRYQNYRPPQGHPDPQYNGPMTDRNDYPVASYHGPPPDNISESRVIKEPSGYNAPTNLPRARSTDSSSRVKHADTLPEGTKIINCPGQTCPATECRKTIECPPCIIPTYNTPTNLTPARSTDSSARVKHPDSLPEGKTIINCPGKTCPATECRKTIKCPPCSVSTLSVKHDFITQGYYGSLYEFDNMPESNNNYLAQSNHNSFVDDISSPTQKLNDYSDYCTVSNQHKIGEYTVVQNNLSPDSKETEYMEHNYEYHKTPKCNKPTQCRRLNPDKIIQTSPDRKKDMHSTRNQTHDKPIPCILAMPNYSFELPHPASPHNESPNRNMQEMCHTVNELTKQLHEVMNRLKDVFHKQKDNPQ